MLKSTLLTLIFAGSLFAQEAAELPRRFSRDDKLYWTSIGALYTAHAIDAHSSWNRPELNPLLQDRQGKFSTSSAAVKFGVVTVGFVIQQLVIKKWPKTQKVFTWINFGQAGGAVIVARKNYQGGWR